MAGDGSSESALLAAVAMANNEAQATYQAALVSSENAANATVESAQIRADAEVTVAQIDAAWHSQVATTEASAAEGVADRNKDAAEFSATTDANARRDVANVSAQASEHAADADKAGTVEAAQIRAAADQAIAAIDAEARRSVATTQANAQTTSAATAANAETTSATTAATAQTTVATTHANAAVQTAQIDAAWHNQVATTEGQFKVQVAEVDASWHANVAQIELTGTEFAAAQQLAGVNAHESGENGRLATKLGFAQGLYNDIRPIIQQIVNGISNSGGILGGGSTPDFHPAPSAPKAAMGFRMGTTAVAGDRVAGGCAGDSRGSYSVRSVGPPSVFMGPLDPPQDSGQASGGASTASTTTITAPYIASRGVLTPAMLQQQVNQAYSRNDARTQTQIRKAQGDLAGRGFSSNSPILDALKVGYVTSNLRASVESASQIRLQAAQANVDAVFRGQQARSEQYIGQEKVILEAQHNQIDQTVGILQAVASLVGGIL